MSRWNWAFVAAMLGWLSLQVSDPTSFQNFNMTWASGQRESEVTDSPLAGMSLGQAVILGVVEGLTEYLPVSSTGHLLVAQRVMKIGGRTEEGSTLSVRRKEASDAYAICIQGGAILAVLILYWSRVRAMAWGILGRNPRGLQLALRVALAFLPAAIVGLAMESRIKQYLFGPWPVAAAWLVGGAVVLWCSRWMRSQTGRLAGSLDELTWKEALVIGLVQCLAMWPGVSRSLATILGGLLVSLSLPAAVEFSFLLGVVTLGAATAFDALKHGQVMAQFFEPLSMAAGFLAAFVSAVVAVRWMVGYLQRHGLELFGYYRIALAVIVSILLLGGMI